MRSRLGIFGVTGRFGKAIAEAALKDGFFQIHAAIAHEHSPHLGKLVEGTKVIVGCDVPKCDVWIDVSTPSALPRHIKIAVDSKTPLVLGTTGLSESDHKLLSEASKQIPLFYAPNFSIGMALLRKLTATTSKFFAADAQIDLIEAHHTQKKDAPSGSALALAKTIQESHACQPNVSIHSIRSGTIVGEHTLLFNTADEKITLSHTAHSRSGFAKGAVAAARFLLGKRAGYYDMDNLLNN